MPATMDPWFTMEKTMVLYQKLWNFDWLWKKMVLYQNHGNYWTTIALELWFNMKKKNYGTCTVEKHMIL